MENKWVQVWGQAHSNLSHFFYPSSEKTYRFVFNTAIAGEALKIELSNEFAKNDVHIGNITVALCDENGALLTSPKRLTVKGKSDFILQKGESTESDSIELFVGTGAYIAVSIFVKEGALRSGNLLNNINLLTVKGDVTEREDIINERRKRDKVIEIAGKVLNLFLHKPLPLLKTVRILNSTDAASIIVFGDSLSQQGFWTNRFEERIRESYPGKYTVINKSIMGNRVLRDYSSRFPCKGLFGPSGLNRLERDVLAYNDCKYVVLALGTNDFLQYETIAAPKSEKPSAQAVFDGVSEIAGRLSAKGIRVIVVNTVKFGYCIDSRTHKEAMAEEYNSILQKHAADFYAVYDQATLLHDENKPNCTKKEYLGKDFLHFNEYGGKVMADNFPIELFSQE